MFRISRNLKEILRYRNFQIKLITIIQPESIYLLSEFLIIVQLVVPCFNISNSYIFEPFKWFNLIKNDIACVKFQLLKWSLKMAQNPI